MSLEERLSQGYNDLDDLDDLVDLVDDSIEIDDSYIPENPPPEIPF